MSARAGWRWLSSPRPYGGRICASVDGSPRAGNMDYRFPNVMELFIDPPGKTFRLMVACIPEDEQTTRLWLLDRAQLRARAAV